MLFLISRQSIFENRGKLYSEVRRLLRRRYLGAAAPPFAGMGSFLGPTPGPPSSFLGASLEAAKGATDPRRSSTGGGRGSSTTGSPHSPPGGALAPHSGPQATSDKMVPEPPSGESYHIENAPKGMTVKMSTQGVIPERTISTVTLFSTNAF